MKGLLIRCARALLDQTVRLYYGRIEVTGGERIPPQGPVILVANHPNSVADACLVATRITSRPVHFIAKDTLTRAPLFGLLARSLGVVGVARPMEYGRNSEEARERNRRAVEACVPLLRDGGVIAIFGEGTSTDAPHLQTLRKGAMRFGYAAEKACGFALGVLWIPVGINYAAKQRFRSDVLVRVGAPLRLVDLTAPVEDETRAVEAGTERLQGALSELIVDIERGDLAPLVERAAGMLLGPDAPLAARVERGRSLTRALERLQRENPVRLREIQGGLSRYDTRLLDEGLTDEVVRQRHPTLALWVSLRGVVAQGALLVLNGYGWINSLIPRWVSYLAGHLARRLEESGGADGRARAPLVQQVAWSTYGGWIGALLAFPLQIALVFMGASAGRGPIVGAAAAAIYALTLVPSWRLFVRRRDLFRRHLARLREALRFLGNARAARRLQGERARVVSDLRRLAADEGDA